MTELREVREPQQQRTRAAWQRALEVGAELFVEGGLDALTVTEVCRRAGMSAPSLYARVDGRDGLIAAVYEHVMVRILDTDRELMGALPPPDAPRDERIAAVVAAASEQFSRNADVLRPIIAASLQDAWVHRRGVEEARRVIDALSQGLALGDEAGRDIATMLFAELVMSTMYGVDFASPYSPDDAELRARLVRMATARADAVDAGA
ncbi:TetR/AcrR family transcriptional regulator [Microbacterium fluvii]|uniref:TetR/AcrR family transcriptional regulator n=1 Tax=Microbacterium fluvii TaxID=415215 RepID=A0ABW2HE47_9MICO|nr:TetR/AcrR family transcriptional regulator [Microbacterium fluvii]MCU4673214.1 TetR/AcrR family transcriptional regulator [Microbacterium fluvii]